jgi:protease-4
MGPALTAAREDETRAGNAASNNIIRQIDLVGPIMTHAPDSDNLFGSLTGGVAYGYEIKQQLLDAAKDDDVKGVLLFTSTPGGTIVGSAAIDDGIKAVKAAGKPVVVYIDMISASGGVWSTANADAIYADHGSLIGSIGVIFGGFMEFIDPVAMGGIFDSVETRGGIKMNIVTAGRGKDIGNPFRPMTDEERAMLQAMNDEFYAKFVAHMAAGRGMDANRIVNEFGAGIFSKDMAEANGYIDGTKTYQEVAAEVATRANLGEDYRVVGVTEEDSGMLGGLIRAVNPQGVRTEEARLKAEACATLTTEVAVISMPHLSQFCLR